jgi:ferrous iron transport protein A
MNKIKIKQLRAGESARITSVAAGNKLYRQRLIAMGLLPGTEFTVVRLAPLGDPIEIEVRGFYLTIRKNEANILTVERV